MNKVENRITQHYVAKSPSNEDEAWEIINTEINNTKKLVDNSTEISVSNLELIHKSSYDLKSSTSKLLEIKPENQDLQKLDIAVIKLHNSSEDHLSNETKENLKEISKILMTINSH